MQIPSFAREKTPPSAFPPVYQSYQWSNGATTPTITVNTGGTYGVTVSNGGTCSSTDDIVVTRRDLPSPAITGGNKICSGESLTLNTTNPFETYFWSNGRTTPAIVVNQGGNYSVTVTDASGCRGTGSLMVAEFSKPVPEITGISTFCEGQSTSLTTSIPYPSYLWSSGENTASISKNRAGLFTVTVTDANGCRGGDSATIIQNDLPTLAVSGDGVFCQNGATQVTAVTNAPQISWSNGATTPNISINAAGNYIVTVRNAAGCQRSDTITIQQQAVPQPFIVDSITICPENSATLQAQGTFDSTAGQPGIPLPPLKCHNPVIIRCK